MANSVRHYDSIIIGSGPAGEGAAMTLAKGGQQVALIETHTDVGGGCTHWGTIPSKALRHSAQLLVDLRSRPSFQRAGFVDLSYQELLSNAASVVTSQTNMKRRFHHRNRVDLIAGTASFVDSNTLEIQAARGGTLRCDADNVVIATGSTPYRPENIDFTHPRVRDSDTILSPDVPEPRSITIYGAGVIGCEYASFFGAMGLKVNLVNTFDRLLEFLDSEITDALGYHLRDMGVTIRNNERYASVETHDNHVVLHCDSGKHFRTDLLLWANGRSGNTDALGLDAIGVERNHRAQLVVDEHLRTSSPHIYAAGDAAQAMDVLRGEPWINALWPCAAEQGRIAALNMAGEEAAYKGSMRMNSVQFFDLSVISAGLAVLTPGPLGSRQGEHDETLEAVKRGDSLKKIRSSWKKEQKAFERRRKAYLIYK